MKIVFRAFLNNIADDDDFFTKEIFIPTIYAKPPKSQVARTLTPLRIAGMTTINTAYEMTGLLVSPLAVGGTLTIAAAYKSGRKAYKSYKNKDYLKSAAWVASLPILTVTSTATGVVMGAGMGLFDFATAPFKSPIYSIYLHIKQEKQQAAARALSEASNALPSTSTRISIDSAHAPLLNSIRRSSSITEEQQIVMAPFSENTNALALEMSRQTEEARRILTQSNIALSGNVQPGLTKNTFWEV